MRACMPRRSGELTRPGDARAWPHDAVTWPVASGHGDSRRVSHTPCSESQKATITNRWQLSTATPKVPELWVAQVGLAHLKAWACTWLVGLSGRAAMVPSQLPTVLCVQAPHSLCVPRRPAGLALVVWVVDSLCCKLGRPTLRHRMLGRIGDPPDRQHCCIMQVHTPLSAPTST